MANWDNLKAAIQDVIKENGNEEITGPVLQNTLLSIVNNLGENATFAGLATPATNPGTPDGVIFYVATQQGTYQYFNKLVVNKGETAIFLYKTSWTKISVAVAPPVLQNSGTSSEDVMSQNAVTEIVGIDDVPQFSDQTSYKTGDFVRYTGLIFKFTAAHSAGTWKGTDTTPSSLAEYLKATSGNTQAKAVTLEKAPYIMHMHYYPTGSRWQIARGNKIILLDVSNVSSIQFADNIPLSPISSIVGMFIIWLDESKTPIGNKIISAGLKVDLPSNAKYVFLEGTFDDNDLIGNYWLSVELKDNIGFSEEQLYTIPDVWDGRTYTINKTFFPVGSVGNNTEVTDNNTASLYVRKCPNINRFRYTNTETEDVRELYFNGINRDNIWEWEQAESNEHKEYYLRREENSDNNTYYFPVEEMMCRGKVHISPAPVAGQNDWFTINLFDKGNNLIASSQGDKDSETEFDYLEFTNKVVDTRRMVKDFNQGYANLYLTEQPTNDFVQPTGSNLVTKYNLINAHVQYRNNRLEPKIQPTNRGGAVMYVPCEEGETYMVGDAIKHNGIANPSMHTTNPVIFLDENKSVVRAFTQEDVTYLKGFSTFWNTGDGNIGYNGYMKFTAPAGAKYMYIQVALCLAPYNEGDITDYPVIVCKEKDVLAAIKTAEKLIYPGVVTGAEISLTKRNTFKNIWILGDSLAGGYGNTSTFEGGSMPGWIRYFVDAVKPKAVYNSSAGGYTLTDASKTFVDDVVQSPSNSFVALLENTISRYNEQPDGHNGIPTPDYVFICGCANDMGKTRGTDVTGNFSGVSYINEADLQSEDINPDSLSYDDLMDKIFIRHNVDYDSYLNEMNEVPIFKIAGAVRYIVLRVGNLFPNCKFVVSTNLINAQSFSYSAQENCNKELRWIANRLSIPVIDVARRTNTPPLWEYKRQGVEEMTRRFLADGVHFYGSADSENKAFNTSAAMRMGYLFASEFERICEYDSVQNIETFDFTTYPHDKNVIFNS